MGGVAYSHIASKKQARKTKPVILIHGAGGAAWYWENWINLFVSAGGYPTYAPNCYGHGGELGGRIGNAGIGTYVDHLAGYIEQIIRPAHGGQIPDIIGHSMGGLIALKLAERNLATRAILIAPAPPHGVHLVPGLDFIVPFRDYGPIVRSFTQRKPFAPSRKFLESLFVDPVASKAMIDRCQAMGLYESPRALWEMLTSSVKVDVTRVTVPMLFIGFKNDRIIRSDVVTKTAALFPQAELHIDKKLGHLCPLEQGWESIAKRCLTWLG